MEEDALFDMAQSFLAQPEEYASALGMTRVKRSAFDKDFKIDALGLQVQIKYKDPNNQLKGGNAVISIDNLKRFIKRAKSSKVVLNINFDGGATPKDGLFKLSVDYELHHGITEKGTFNMERKKAGGQWMMDMSITGSNNGQNIFQPFSLSTKSDRKTKMEGTFTCSDGTYTINVDRTPGKKIHAVIEGRGKKYIINGVLDKAAKTIVVDIDANGLKYKINVDFDMDGPKYEVKAAFNLGASGKYNIEFDAKKDRSEMNGKITFNDRNFANFKVKGKSDANGFKYEARYSAVGAGDGKIRLRVKTGDTKELMFQYLPNNGLDLKLEASRELHSDRSRHIRAKVTRGGETYLEYKNDIIPTTTPNSYELKVDSTFDMSEKSKMYSMFCKYGCFKNRKMSAKLYVETAQPHKMSLDIGLTKDGETVLTVEINSRNNPYVFKVSAPRLLPKILPTGRGSIEFSADHKPGKSLIVTSNTNMIKEFKVEKMAGNTRKISLNGKELVQAGYSSTSNSISQTTTLPDGKSLTTTVTWESENLHKNKVNIKLDGTERKLNADLSWDVTNPSNMVMTADAKGENKKWGKYELKRNLNVSKSGSKFNAKLKGVSSIANAPWPSPVNTDIDVSFDTNARDYKIDIKKSAAGRNFGITLNNGRLSVNI